MGVKMISFEGGCIHTAIDDFEIRPHGGVQAPQAELRRLLAFGGVDRSGDGTVRALQISEERLCVRRDGWRLQVWPEGAPEPPRDPRPAPPGALRDQRAKMATTHHEASLARRATLRKVAWALSAGLVVFSLAATLLLALLPGR